MKGKEEGKGKVGEVKGKRMGGKGGKGRGKRYDKRRGKGN
jgi:hypothetical protein